MSGAQGRAAIRTLLDKHGHRPNKQLGQHFLADPNTIERIVALAEIGPGDRVVEVGAGTGTLTLALAATGAAVVAYEVDEHLRPVLTEALAGVDVDLRFADVTAVDLVAELGDGPWTMVANLPYNVGTPLLLEALRAAPNLTRFVVMVQREVAARLSAGPGSKRYGFPSVVVGLRSRVRSSFPVGRSVFLPPPDVDSAVIEIVRVTPHRLVDAAERLAGAAFGQRRKMLRRSLATVLPDPLAVLGRAGIDPTSRAEDLPPEAYLEIAEAAEQP